MSKVLVVEDDKFLANAYRVKLEKTGFEVKIASNGEEGLALAKEFSPKIILLDLVMPKKDGFAVLEELQADENLKKIPVIVASNLGQKTDIDKAKKMGAKDYIVKSDESLQSIMEKIQKYLDTDKAPVAKAA